MFGHRADGKKVKNLEPIFRILPSIMIDRSDAQVYFKQDIPLSNMDEYIDKKAQDGIRMSYMNIIYAGIVRIINERPKVIINEIRYNFNNIIFEDDLLEPQYGKIVYDEITKNYECHNLGSVTYYVLKGER